MLRGKAQVRCQCNHCACSGGHTIEGSDDRFIQHAHALHHGPGHVCKFQVLLHVPFQQLTDNVVNITARTEVISRAGKYNSVYFLIITQRFKEIAKLVIYLEGEGIHDLGAVEGQGRNAFAHFVQKIISHSRPLSHLSLLVGSPSLATLVGPSISLKTSHYRHRC